MRGILVGFQAGGSGFRKSVLTLGIAIRYQVNQIGHEERATAFITGLFNDAALKPNVHCTSEKLDDKIQELKDNEANLDNWVRTPLPSFLQDELTHEFTVGGQHQYHTQRKEAQKD